MVHTQKSDPDASKPAPKKPAGAPTLRRRIWTPFFAVFEAKGIAKGGTSGALVPKMALFGPVDPKSVIKALAFIWAIFAPNPPGPMVPLGPFRLTTTHFWTF